MLHVFETAEPVEWCLKKFHGLQSTIYLRTPRDECKFTRYGATESGILGYQIPVIQRYIQGICNQNIWGLDGPETNAAFHQGSTKTTMRVTKQSQITQTGQ